MAIRIDYTNMLAAAVPGAIAPDAWQQSQREFGPTHAAVQAMRTTGVLGFLDLPGNAALHAQCTTFAARVNGRFDDVVLLGIGGSALGPIALRTALCKPDHNALSDADRSGSPRLHVFDNVDPGTIAARLARLDLARTLVVVISKSGGTAETMAQYLIVRERLNALPGQSARDHLVFVTDPERGALREIARREKIPTMNIPPNVGGRFSVLTPVGILPAALLGLRSSVLTLPIKLTIHGAWQEFEGSQGRCG